MEQYIAGKEDFDTALNPTQTILFSLQAAHQQETPGTDSVLAQGAPHPPPFVLIRSMWVLLSTKPLCAHSGSSASLAMPTGFTALFWLSLCHHHAHLSTGREQKDADHNAWV